MIEFTSVFGRRLYEALPALYRERDNTVRDEATHVTALGDLARYLDALGILLDRHRGALDQRLADSFPDTPRNGLACQEWMIPYFASLLDVRLVGATIEGQRAEVASAIRWRQAKGSLPTAEEIGEVIGGRAVEVSEGWRRVIVTPRVDDALLPARFFGVEMDAPGPLGSARHPGLAAATVDLRCRARALRARAPGPTVRESLLGGATVEWIQADPHGTPEVPGSFDDPSRRTVDLRTPRWDRGHAHPRRLLVHAPIPRGLFAPAPVRLPPPPKPPPPMPPPRALTEADLRASPHVSWQYDPAARTLEIRARFDRPVTIVGDLPLPDDLTLSHVLVEGLRVTGTIRVANSAANRRHLSLRHVVATRVEVETAFFGQPPVLDATDCLLGDVAVPSGSTSLTRCTVRRGATCWMISARDTIFAGTLTAGGAAPPSLGGCELIHCSIPEGFPPEQLVDHDHLRITNPVHAAARFLASTADDPTQPLVDAAGVLAPDGPSALRAGATDGGELGVRRAHRRECPIVVDAAQRFEFTEPEAPALEDLVFTGAVRVTATALATLRLRRVALLDLKLDTPARSDAGGRPSPVLDATSCLFERLETSAGLARLEYCTVLVDAKCKAVHASESIFAGKMDEPKDGDCVRLSRVPAETLARGTGLSRCTSAPPVFFERDFLVAAAGRAGGGVLHPAAAAILRHGAEDGGELGAHHDLRASRVHDAVLEKLADHLAVGLEAVLIPDRQLDEMPPAVRR